MKRFPLVILIWLFTAGHVQSQSFWRDRAGTRVPETESMKSNGDFGGFLLVVTDEDWQAKWETPSDTTPEFHKAGSVPYGKKVFALTFFSNPKLDQREAANVRCDLKLLSPTGKVTLAEKDVVCYTGKIKGNPRLQFLAEPVISFSGDPDDPPGVWIFEVTLRDAVRDVMLSLRTSFELKR